MSNKNINNQGMTHAEFKHMLKRMWICIACLIPVVLLLTVLFSKLGMAAWLAMLLNIIIGGLICLLVYIIFGNIDRKKRLEKMLKPKEEDPFSD